MFFFHLFVKLTNIKLFNKLIYLTNRLIYVKFLNYTLSRKLDKFLALVTLKMWSEAPGKKICLDREYYKNYSTQKLHHWRLNLKFVKLLVLPKFEISENRENNNLTKKSFSRLLSWYGKKALLNSCFVFFKTLMRISLS